MMNVDHEALECDLAQTYHIYEMKELSACRVALFSCGLRENSRIKLKISNNDYSIETLLLAKISDELAISNWIKSGHKEKNKPISLLNRMLKSDSNKNNQSNDEIVNYASSKEFDKARNEFFKRNEVI